MMDWILMGSGLLVALVAGVFLGFSDFIMRGLAQAPASQGAAGMVGLNRTVYRSVFMVLLLGLVPVSALLCVLGIWHLDGPARALTLAGSVAYGLGVFAVTGLGNVPMNTRLDAMDGQPRDTAEYWPHYAQRWTRLNHARTAGSALSALCWLTAAQIV
jgi:Predicted integral membrane protein